MCVGGGVLAVITLSISPRDGLYQPTGLMFDRIIRKLSQAVITGAHLAEDYFHSLSATHASKNTLTQTAEQEPSVVDW